MLLRQCAFICAAFVAAFTGAVRADSPSAGNIVNLVSPSVVTNYNKYGDDVITVSGWRTNSYPSITAALAASRPGDAIELTADARETVSVNIDWSLGIDLKGHRLESDAGQTDVLRFTGSDSNAVLSVANGTLVGNLRFGTPGTMCPSSGLVVLGPGLIADGDIFATGNVLVMLQNGFHSTYTNGLFSTDVPLQACEGAVFDYRQNPVDASEENRLFFPEPDLQLVSRGGGFVVGHPIVLKRWSYDLSHWMQDIPSDTPISRVCLPSSHDSGMVEGTGKRYGDGAGGLISWIFSSRAYLTQSLKVKSQLEVGCRRFDFRFRVADDDQLRTYHSPGSGTPFGFTGESLDEILDAFRTFLESNPSEFVIAEISHWGISPKSNAVGTFTRTINTIHRSALWHEGLVFHTEDDSVDPPVLNTVPLGEVRGKVIFLIDTNGGTYPSNPVEGTWEYGNDVAVAGAGMFNISDHYANTDDVTKMKVNQLAKWMANAGNPENRAFSLDWTLTGQDPARSGKLVGIVARFVGFEMPIAAFVGILITVVTLTFLGLPAAWVFVASVFASVIIQLVPGLIEYKVYESGNMYIDKLAAKANRELASTLDDCIIRGGYAKPSFVSLDFVDSALCKKIIELNLDLCRYAAEVVSSDGSYCKKYESLNCAFTNELLRTEGNDCVVRLLRTEEPEKDEIFSVAQDAYVRFDLNGKWINPSTSNRHSPVLVNFGDLEIFNSSSEAAGFGRTGNAFGIDAAVVNQTNGQLKVRGVRCELKTDASREFQGFVLNRGVSVLEDVDAEGSFGIGNESGTMTLRNCTIVPKDSVACRVNGGSVSLYGTRLGVLGNHHPVKAEGTGELRLYSGEIKGNGGNKDTVYASQNSRVEILDGFVKGNSSGCFTSPDSSTNIFVHGGCFGRFVPQMYIVDGVCRYADNYPEYPYEVTAASDGRSEVARIVETRRKYDSVQRAVDAVDPRQGHTTVELLCNIHPVEPVVIPANTGVKLDLNGKRLTKRGTDEPAIRNFGGLTIVDSCTNGLQGSITVFDDGEHSRSENGGIIYNEGTLSLENGRLCGGLAVDGAGIYNQTNGLCRVSGGEISGCQATRSGGGIYNRGVLSVQGGSIAGNSADQSGGGIRNDGFLRIFDGYVLTNSAAVGGGVYNALDTVLFGGEIADNLSTQASGAGIYADAHTQTTICGAFVKDPIDVVYYFPGSAKFRISEGLFGEAPKNMWILPGSIVTTNGEFETGSDYPFRVVASYAAGIGNELYPTLDAALVASGQDETTVKLLTHIRNTDVLLPDYCRVTLDLAGHWILGRANALTVPSNGRLRIVDSVGGGRVGCLFSTNAAQSCSIRNNGICRIEGGGYADALVNASANATMSVRAGIFSLSPESEWVDPSSELGRNPDEYTYKEYPFAVVAKNTACFPEEPGDTMTLQRALRSARLGGEDLESVAVAEDASGVSLTIPAGRRAVLDLCGHRLQGVSRKPVITVEKGATLIVVDSLGGGMILKGDAVPYDPELEGGIANYGEFTLAGGTISNCVGRTYGGVYNAEGAVFIMSGGAIVGCGSTMTLSGGAAGVLNEGTFWLFGGEISDCDSAKDVMGVENASGAVMYQLGGVIRSGSHGMRDGDSSCCVENEGTHYMIDGQITCAGSRTSGPVSCVREKFTSADLDARSVYLWGELSGDGSGPALEIRGGYRNDPKSLRISNGIFCGTVINTGWVSSSFGETTGGFFDGEITNTLLDVNIPEFSEWRENTDAATRAKCSHRVVPTYEVEISGPQFLGYVTMEEALVQASIHPFTNIKLLTDVKECITITNTASVTIDLNGFAITGTGKVFGDGFARPVICNEGTLTIVDNSEKKSGFIAMPSTGRAEKGGAICNYGRLVVSGIPIFGCRAQSGGGLYNASGASATLDSVELFGCSSSDSDNGDLIGNSGTLELSGCSLDAWPIVGNGVRDGVAIVNDGSVTITETRVKGQIKDIGEGCGIGIYSGLFDHEPFAPWIASTGIVSRNVDDETSIAYRWVVGDGMSIDVVAGEGVTALACRIGTGDYESVDLSEGRTFSGITPTTVLDIHATYVENGHQYEVAKSVPIFRRGTDGMPAVFVVDRDVLFDAAVGDVLYPTVTDALTASYGDIVKLLHDVYGDGHLLPAGNLAVLDLNGYKLCGDGEVSVIVNEGDLTLRDGSENGSGRITVEFAGGVRWLPECGGGICNFGRFTLESGIIENCYAEDFGGGIYGYDRSETCIRGGEIRSCGATAGAGVYSVGRFAMSGGAVRDSLMFEGLPSDWKGPEVSISGGVLGCKPEDPSWIVASAVVVDNEDPDSREFYPYRVVDSLDCDPVREVVRVDSTYFTTNSTVLIQNRIYRFVEDVSLSGSTDDPVLASALSATTGLTVLYIDEGVTVSLTGAVARTGRPGHYSEVVAGSGLRIPSSATVVVTGSGTLRARGGSAIAGGNGGSGKACGKDGLITITGNGGVGGHGGAGAAAAIGGCGGEGGAGGEGGEGDGWVISHSGESGRAGGNAASGEGMGTFIVQGSVRIEAVCDVESRNGGTAGSSGPCADHGNGGGGGGGGGGAGGLPDYGIGGGGGGGAGGGGGGAGGYSAGSVLSDSDLVGQTGRGGRGGLVGGNAGGGGSEAGSFSGWGGSSGLPGNRGDNGAYYAGTSVSVTSRGHAEMDRVARTLAHHGSLRRQLTIRTESGALVGILEAYAGEPLPTLNPDEVAAWGEISGLYYRTGDGIGEQWYDDKGIAVKAVYDCEDLDDVTLYLELDDEEVVAVVSDDMPFGRKFKTLDAAVSAAHYGAVITIVGDVTGENVKIPSGTTIMIGENGRFRPPEAGDLLYDYYLVRTIRDGETTVGYEYCLDPDKVTPMVGDDTDSSWIEFVRDGSDRITSAILNLTNAYEDLYYGVDSGLTPTGLVPAVNWEKSDERGTLRLSVPAGGSGYFYRIRATDHPPYQ